MIWQAATRLGTSKRIGWHTFRRTIATLLYSGQESDVKVTQELMRHATSTVRLGVYAQAVTDEKTSAQNRIAKIIAAVAIPA